ncbi:hypothetical protein C2G38_2180431 [Gigaspora rosea]|uniref:SWIM-type domain-containing protein n=1 Tax=Gigaspora rosea TaxID=44941 RepID=A0A397VD91_9GLOM|nr:hypothetical protein C2G38_2180431 [Gigaspora rosea]
MDDVLDTVLDATESVVNEYVIWIKNLEYAELSYVWHDCRSISHSNTKKTIGLSDSIAIVTDLCTLSLSKNIREFVQKRVFEVLNTFSIQKLLKFRAVELKDQIKRDTKGYLQDVQTLWDTFIICDDIYQICTHIDFLKHENEVRPNIFMVDVAEEEIKAVGESFPDKIIWKDLWRLLRTEEWSNSKTQQQIDIWLVRSMTNNDIKYSVRKRDNSDETNLDITSYICSCLDFRKYQLACKHIFSVLAQLRIYDDNKKNEHVNIETYDRNVEITKLQKDLSAIIVEWRKKNAQDICSLQESFRQTAQAERARIARAEILPQVNEMKTSQIASNIKSKSIIFIDMYTCLKSSI